MHCCAAVCQNWATLLVLLNSLAWYLAQLPHTFHLLSSLTFPFLLFSLFFLLCNILPLYTLALFASSSFLVLFFISLNTSWLVLVILSHFLPLHLHPLFLFFLFLLPLLFSSLFFPMSNYCSSFSSALFLFPLLFGVLLFLLLTNCSICLFVLFLDSPPNNQITSWRHQFTLSITMPPQIFFWPICTALQSKVLMTGTHELTLSVKRPSYISFPLPALLTTDLLIFNLSLEEKIWVLKSSNNTGLW